MSVTSDEVNYLVYRYLQESGFIHASYAFGNEAHISKSDFKKVKLAPGALVAYLQKGLLYTEAETHLKDDGTERPCQRPFHLLEAHECEKGATKSRSKKAKKKEKEVPKEPIENMDMDTSEPMEQTEQPPSTSLPPPSPRAQAPSKTPTEQIEQHAPIPRTLTNPKKLVGHGAEVFQCCISPDRSLLATGAGDSTILLWDCGEIHRSSEDTIKKKITLSHGDPNSTRITSIDWRYDSKMLLSGALDGLGRLWTRAGKLQKVFKGHAGPVLAIKFSPDGKHAVSASVDGKCILWHIDSGDMVRSYAHHKGAAMDAAWRSSDIFATAGTDGKIMFCSIRETTPQKVISAHASDTNHISWSSDKRYLASCSDDKTVKIWRGESEQPFLTFRDHTKEVYSTRWSKNGAYFASSSTDTTVKVYSMPDGKLLYTLSGHKGGVYSMDFSENGDFIFTGCMGGHLYLWETRTGSKLAHVRGEGSVYDLKWDEVHQWLYVALGRKDWGAAFAYQCRLAN